MKENKGFTVIELLVTFALAIVIVFFLVQIVFILRDLYISNGVKTELLNKQSLLSYKINQEFITKDLRSATKCGSNCINFLFGDGTTTKLQIDKTNNTITFGDYVTELVSGSEFGDIDVSANLSITNDNNKNNAILNIDIPIFNKLFEDNNFGVNVNLQYNTADTKITNIVFDDSNSSNGHIMIKGKSSILILSSTKYIDPGYIYFDSEGNSSETSPYVEVVNPFNTLVPNYTKGDYKIIYKLKDTEGNVIQTLERTVTVVGNYEIVLLGDAEITGKYVDGEYVYDEPGYNIIDELGNIIQPTDNLYVEESDLGPGSNGGNCALARPKYYYLKFNGETIDTKSRIFNQPLPC